MHPIGSGSRDTAAAPDSCLERCYCAITGKLPMKSPHTSCTDFTFGFSAAMLYLTAAAAAFIIGTTLIADGAATGG